MQRALTPTLAIIVAGGLAAGIALARPANPTGTIAQQTGVQPAGTDEPAAAADPAATADAAAAAAAAAGGYRQGNRDAGVRGGPADTGTPNAAAAPAPAAPVPAAPAPAAITIEGFAFAGPGTVEPGAALSVTNLDGAPHTLTFRNGEADTGTLAANVSGTVTAPVAPGTYEFFCQIHPSMQGSITVV